MIKLSFSSSSLKFFLRPQIYLNHSNLFKLSSFLHDDDASKDCTLNEMQIKKITSSDENF